MRYVGLFLTVAAVCGISSAVSAETDREQKQVKAPAKEFTVRPIGWVRKSQGRTTIVVDKKYEKGLLGLDKFREVWVLYWFDRNDTPQKRAVLQVHPRGDPKNPVRGVFATHAPVRPNLIAMTRCEIVSVQSNVIQIKEIDALPDTPVLDLKSAGALRRESKSNP